MGHIVQISGALLVLAAFALTQARVISPAARSYLLLNVVGATILAVDAYVGRQWGFLLLEGAWAVIAAWSLVAGALSRYTRDTHHPGDPLGGTPR